MSESYAGEQALSAAREGDVKFTLAYIVGCLTDPTPDAIASAIEMAKAFEPNLYGKQWLIPARAREEQIDKIIELLKPIGS